MKITNIECIPVQAPGRTLVPVLVETDEGITGVGEAGLQRRWRAIAGAVEHLREWLIGEDPMRIEYLWQKMYRGGFYPGDRLIGSAISGIDIALWDIKGQKLGVPVYELLGGRCRDHVECFFQPDYFSLSIEHPQDQKERQAYISEAEAVKAARKGLELGMRFYRIGPGMINNVFSPGESLQNLLNQMYAVRNTLGDDVELMVDLHTRVDPPDAVWFCRRCEELRVYAIEDPVRSENINSYRHIRQHTRVPLAAGEQWANKWEFRQVIEEELIDYARVDLCIAGGLSEGKKIAAMAETHSIKTLLHNPLGPICTAASLHLDLAIDNAGPQELLWPPQEMLPDVFECDFKLDGCSLTIPTAPGLGVRFNKEAAKAYPAQMTEPPHCRRGDGSFTNY